MTLAEIINEAYEKTHLDRVEIHDIVTRNWPNTTNFGDMQARLLVNLIERKYLRKEAGQ